MLLLLHFHPAKNCKGGGVGGGGGGMEMLIDSGKMLEN